MSLLLRPSPDTAPEVLHVRTAKVIYPEDPDEDYYAEWSEWASMGSGGGVPSGFIGMWSGVVDQIPEGWLLCNGQNGTPDLRDRFIVGAGTTYAVGATGGAASVTPAGSVSNTVAGGTVANTTLATWQIPSHTHPNYGCGWGKWTDGSADWRGISGGQDPVNIATAAEGGSGAHNHGFTGTSHGHTFTGASLENRPPYYALAYIMKT